MSRRCGRRSSRARRCRPRPPWLLWRRRCGPRRGAYCRASASGGGLCVHPPASGGGLCVHPPAPQSAVGPAVFLSMPAVFLLTLVVFLLTFVVFLSMPAVILSTPVVFLLTPAATLAATDNPMTPRMRIRPQAPPPRALVCPRRMGGGIVMECRAPASTWGASRRGTPLTRAATWRCPWGRAEFLCRWGRRRCRCSGLAPTGPLGAPACVTRTARPRRLLASWNFPWVIWRPCRRPETTWDRWVEWRASNRGMRALVASVRARITLVALVLSLLPLRPPGAALAVPPLVTHRELPRVK